jgi:hypothetical protein
MVVKMKTGDISQISEEEKQAYIDHAKKKYPNEIVDEIIIDLDGEFVNIEIHKHSIIPFTRIRRITGYLVSDMSRWNGAKKAEEHDRVKHTIDDPEGVY